jgi:hypothetical protein
MKMMIIMMSGLLKGLKSKCGGDCQMICITSKRRVDDDDDDKGAFYLRHIYNHFLAFAQMEQKTNFWLFVVVESKQASKQAKSS